MYADLRFVDGNIIILISKFLLERMTYCRKFDDEGNSPLFNSICGHTVYVIICIMWLVITQQNVEMNWENIIWAHFMP